MRIVAQASSDRWWRTNERSVHDGAADAELAKGLCPATSSRMPSSLENRESRRSCGADTGVPSARGFGALGWHTLVRSSSVSSTLPAEPLERDSLLCEVRLYQFAPPDQKRRTLVLTRNSALAYLSTVTVAPVTPTIRRVPSTAIRKTRGPAQCRTDERSVRRPALRASSPRARTHMGRSPGPRRTSEVPCRFNPLFPNLGPIARPVNLTKSSPQIPYATESEVSRNQ